MTWINTPIIERLDQFHVVSEGLQMFDSDGKAVSTQNNGYTVEKYCVAEGHTRAFPYDCQRHRNGLVRSWQ